MLTLYIDDSGTDLTSPFCVLAGFVADRASWEQFSTSWRRVLQADPPLAFLKMSQAHRMQGPFRSWSIEQRDTKLAELTAVIEEYVWFGVASIVSTNVYEKLAKGCLPATVDHPYWLCFQGVCSAVHLAEYVDEKLDFVFDLQGTGYERRAQIMHSAVNTDLAAYGDLRFADEKIEVPLQAADMYAWHIRRHADDAVLDRSQDRPIAERLWSIPNSTLVWEPHAIASFVDLYNDLHPESPENRPDLHRRS